MKKKKTAKRFLQPRVIVSDMLAGVWKAFLIISFLFVILGIWLLHTSRILPYTRKWFPNYGPFFEKVQKTEGCKIIENYPEKLPASAGEVRYIYHYTGWDTETGISFRTSDEDYHKIKEWFLSFYLNGFAEYPDRDSYVFNRKVTSVFLEKEELEYLEEIFHDPMDHYTVLAYQGDVTGGEYCSVQGVFYNDRTNEIVIFAFSDAFRQERQ